MAFVRSSTITALLFLAELALAIQCGPADWSALAEGWKSVRQIDRSVLEAGRAIRKRLTADQNLALRETLRTSRLEDLTEPELASQVRKLQAAGFRDGEIQSLRRAGILPRHVVTGTQPVVRNLTETIVPLGQHHLQGLKNGGKVFYVATDDGKILISPETIKMADNELLVAGRSANGTPRIVTEMGEIRYIQAKNQYEMVPKSTIDSVDPESRVLAEEVAELAGDGAKVAHVAAPTKSQVVKCLDVLNRQSRGGNFVLNRVLSDAAVTTTGLILTDPSRISDPNKREIMAADLAGGALASAVGGQVGRFLSVNNKGMVTSLSLRTLQSMGWIQVQKQIYEHTLSENAAERAQNIASFDQLHFFARLPVNHYFDKFLVQRLPQLLYEACQRDSAAKIFLSPTMVRIYERYGSAIVYYGLRKSLVGD